MRNKDFPPQSKPHAVERAVRSPGRKAMFEMVCVLIRNSALAATFHFGTTSPFSPLR